MINRMILNETSYFGKGAIRSIVDEIKKRGFTKALIVTDKDLIKFNVATKITALLEENGLAYAIYDEVVPNPTVNVVHKGVEAFKQAGADYLIAVGGGSPQDTCKAIGMMMANPEYTDVRMLEGGAPTRNPSIPIIAILKWFTEFGHLNRGDMLTSEQHRCHNEKKKFQRRV